MQKPEFITFTGFDDRTNISDMKGIAGQYPVEWGVLVSPTNRESRYPSKQAISELTENLMNLSLHCCGGFSKGFQLRKPINLPIESFKPFERIQLNGKIYEPPDSLTVAMEDEEFCDIIIQAPFGFHESRKPLLQLFDTSGGRGKLPNEFPEHPGYLCGYAGGINPDNVLDVIKKINAPDGARYWIDMESGVRTNGWFDLDKVASVCIKVYDIL